MVHTTGRFGALDQPTHVDVILVIIGLPIQAACENLCPELSLPRWFDLLMDDADKVL